MQLNLDGQAPDLGRMRLALHQHLRALEVERDRLSDEISETERRIRVLHEVWSWDIPEVRNEPAQPVEGMQVEPLLQNGDARLLGMGLVEAIVYLRRGNPELNKRQARERLESVGYRFRAQGPNIGRAIHTAWIAADRRLVAE